MRQLRSIRFRLSAVFFFFFVLVLVLGLFSIGRLSDFNRVSADIRDRWLPNTRLLGDLNNFTSDFRAAEGRYLLSQTPAEVAATEKEMEELDLYIERAQRGYERIHNDPGESRLYEQFTARWNDYRNLVGQVVQLLPTDRRREAITLYSTTSQSAYDAASDTLGQLTDRNVAAAREANDRADSAYRQARWLIGVAMLFAGVLGAGALLYVRHAISRPLLNLAGRMHRLAENDTDIDIPGTQRRDEIGEMARAVVVFRNNAIELMLSQQGLAQQASMLEERLAHEQRLTELQRNFVSMASHEFRTPLTIIDGHAQRMIKTKDRLGAEEIAERAGKIRTAVLRMTSLMDNLLNSSRLFDGGAGLYYHPVEIDLAALLHDVCQLHREIAPRSQIWEDFGGQPLPVVGDSKLLFQVFSNLLSNAIKYSPGGGLIKIGARTESGQVAVVVEDRGIGIPE
ncbi:MAG TPA: MCP four helix bundle domain-containing protein, partial [Xanthobacteraceae bacterium]|nr:MCP four helix bundle domain-containing protein [Xanthobacteraceae bacterium]